jgi:hypothetical protein
MTANASLLSPCVRPRPSVIVRERSDKHPFRQSAGLARDGIGRFVNVGYRRMASKQICRLVAVGPETRRRG